ncbi:MAG: 30S ribosomal protein S20 [Verrucomicrobia bacterium]|nr:MAG: 30S ribosomal protein S20 [Verrucomicrobiota bacterium]
MASSNTSKTAPKKSDSATKRAKQGAVRHERNVSVATSLKTMEKKVLKALGGEADELKKVFEQLSSMLDKAVKKGVLHKNKAARKKSLFNARVTPGAAAPVKLVKKVKAARGESAKEKSRARAKIKSKSKK